MKRRLLLLTLSLILLTGSSVAQSIIIGTGTSTTNGFAADPIERYYNYTHFQIVYTATELSDAGLPPNATISAIGFSVSESAVSLANFTIDMGHTTQATANPYISNGLTNVVPSFTYAPTAQTAGDFDMITFTTNFVWDGTSNIVINTCTGSNPYISPYGGLRYTTATSGSVRYIRTDGSSNCANSTVTNGTARPNIKFEYTAGSGPDNPATFTAIAATFSEIDLDWTQNGDSDNVLVAWSTDGTFGTPMDGSTYNSGDPISGGGTVLYYGSALHYDHTALSANTQYFYKAWSYDGSEYSFGKTSNATTASGKATNPTPANNAMDILVTAKTFDWDDVPGAYSYTIDIGTATGLSDIVDDGACASSTYTFTGNDWDGNEDYFWTVTTVYTAKAIIEGDEWSFTTACAASIATLSENFDGLSTPAIPNCWSNITTSPAVVETYTLSTPHSSPNHVRLNNNSGSTATAILVSPQFSDLSTHTNQIRFWAKSGSNGYNLLVGTLSDPADAGTFSQLTSISLTTTYTEYTVTITSGTDEYIGFKHGLGGTNRSIYIDDFVYELAPTCPNPNTQTAGNITSSSVEMGWTETGTATTWQIEYGADGFTQGSGTTITDITSNPYSLTGLSGNTAYDWYVRSDCGDSDFSDWIGPGSFTTAVQGETCDDPLVISSLPYTSTDNTSNYGDDYSSADEICSSSNYLNGDDVVYAYTPATNECINITLSNTGTWVGLFVYEGCAPFTTCVESNVNSTGNPALTNVSLTGGTTYYILISTYPSPQSTAYDLEVANCPTCLDPTTLTETNILATSVDLGWTETGASTTWEIEYGTDGFTQGTGTTITGITSNPYTLNGLSTETAYDWYVRADCGSGDYSDWVGPGSFTTLESCPDPSLQTEGNITLNSAKLGWTENGTATTWDIEWGANGFTQGAGTMISGTTTNPHEIIGLTANTSYDWYVRADCGSSDYSNWVGPNTFSTVEGKAINPDPADNASDVSVTATTLDWDDVSGNGSITYTITIGTATGGNDIADAVACAISEYTHGSDWSGTTEYFWTVTTVYTTSKAEVTGDEWSFTTGCSAMSVSFFEDFDGVSTPTLPQCWSSIVVSPSSVATYTSSTPHSGSNHIRLYNSYSSTANAILVSPELGDLSSNTNQFRFYAKSSSTGQPLLVGTLNDPADANTFTQVESLALTSTYTEYIVTFTSTTDAYVAFKHGHGGTYRSIYIDDVNYEPIPSCPYPSLQTESNITLNTAGLGWTENGTATTWDIEWGANGFTQGAGTMISGTTTNPHEIIGLAANTSYDWYVRADCGGGDYSNWVGPKAFSSANGKAVNPDPADNSTDVSVTATTLNWDDVSGNGAISYKITIGTTTGGNDIADAVACATSEYTHGSDWSGVTEYFWTVSTVYNTSLEVTGDEWSFITACAPYASPFSEDFDGTYLPECWYEATGDVPSPTQGGSVWNKSTNFGNASGNTPGIKMNVYGLDNDWLITPEIDLGAGNKQVSFKVAATSYNGTNPVTMSSDDKVYVLINADGSWDLADAIVTYTDINSPSNTGDEETFVLTGWSGNVRFAFYTKGSGNSPDMDIHFDDLLVEEVPSCPNPEDQTEASITASSVSLGWTETGTATAWQIEYGPDGFTQGAGTSIIDITSNPYTLSGLSDNSAYDWYVRADCGGGDYSEWVGPGGFTTLESCPNPTVQTESNITLNSAELGWTENGTATTWDIELGANGFTPTGTPTASGLTSNLYTYTGLTANTSYDWYVRSDCGGSDYSNWVGPNTFSTADGKATNPTPADNALDVALDSKTFDWDDVSGADSYKITIGTESGLYDIVDEAACPASTYTFTGSNWDGNEDYYWTITTVYNTNQEVVGNEWAFLTVCGATSVPYTENFDGVTAPAMPACMTVENTNEDSYTWVTNTTYDLSAPNCAYIRYNGSLAMNDWLFTEGLNLTGGVTYQLDFAYRVFSASFPEKLSVYWGNSATSAAMSNGPIFDESLTNTTYATTGVTFTPATSGTYYIGFHGHSDADKYYLMLDDISVTEALLTATWTGAAAKSNDWHTAGNWDVNAVPGSSTDVSIPAGLANYPTILAAAECDDITLEDGATMVGQENLSVNGTAYVQKFITGYTNNTDGWYCISSPLSRMAMEGSDFEPNENEDDLYAYDETVNTWRNYLDPVNPTTWFDEFDPVIGYIVGYLPANAGFKSYMGDFNADASYTLNLTNTPSPGTGWSLIGNPYPSKYAWSNVSLTGVSSPKSLNATSGEWEDLVPGAELEVGQGVFVKAETASPSVSFAREHQTHGIPGKDFTNTDYMKLKASFGDLSVHMWLVANEDASQAYEWRHDARYMYPFTEIPYLSAVTSDNIWVSKYAFNPSDETTIIPLYFKVGSEQQITFNIESMGKWANIDKVTLEDTYLNEFILLSDGKAYTFDASPNDDESRFKLHLEGSTSISEISGIDGLNIYTNNNVLYLKSKSLLSAKVGIYNITGQEILHKEMILQGLQHITLNVNQGWYVVKVMSNTGVMSKKVFIR